MTLCDPLGQKEVTQNKLSFTGCTHLSERAGYLQEGKNIAVVAILNIIEKYLYLF